MSVFSGIDKIKKILFGDVVIDKVYFGNTLVFSNSCKVTWKFLEAYPDTRATVDEYVEFGGTPSRALPSEVVSGNEKKVAKEWDDLSAVTSDRIITCSYDVKYKATSFSGEHCSTAAATGWYNPTDKITWNAAELYWFGNNALTKETTVTPGKNTCSAEAVPTFTLTATNYNPDFGDIVISRTSSPYARAAIGSLVDAGGETATIYKGDVLAGQSLPKPDESGSWGDWEVIPAPTVTSSGSAAAGNLSITNTDSSACTMYYNTTDSTAGGTSAGVAAGGASARVTSGISFGGTYYCYASRNVKRTGTGYHYTASAGNYTGTSEVTMNVIANFSFSKTEGQTEQTQLGYSATTAHMAAVQDTYTVSFVSTTNATWSSTTTIENVPYGTSISSTISNGTYKGTGSVTVNGYTRSCSTVDGSSPLQPMSKYALSLTGVPSSKKVTNNLTISCSVTGTNPKAYGTKFVFKVRCGRFDDNPLFKDQSLLIDWTADAVGSKGYITLSRRTQFGLNTTASQPSSYKTAQGNMTSFTSGGTYGYGYSYYDDFAEQAGSVGKYAYRILLTEVGSTETLYDATNGWKLHTVNQAGQKDSTEDVYEITLYSKSANSI